MFQWERIAFYCMFPFSTQLDFSIIQCWSVFLNKNFLDPKLPSFDGQLFKSIKKYTFKCMYELDFNLIFIEKKNQKFLNAIFVIYVENKKIREFENLHFWFSVFFDIGILNYLPLWNPRFWKSAFLIISLFDFLSF